MPDPHGDQPVAAVQAWIERCRLIAAGPLDGIEAPAQELADLAAGDRRLMERARRLLLAEQQERPDDPIVAQMLSLWRRAFEKGSWSWDDD